MSDLAQAIPFGHVVLNRLGLTADTRRLHALRATSEPDPAHLAALLDRVGGGQAEMGDRDAALATIIEAVSHYRTLAQASPAHLPDLADALSNLAVRQAETGDRDGALATSSEAVGHYRTLAQASPAHLPDLANALSKLSAHQAETGDRDGALATVTEAVGHYRTLAQASPAIYLPGFANALNNLAVHQGETGDQDGALATITEAVQLPHPGSGQPGRPPARPRRGAEQPVPEAGRNRGPGRARWPLLPRPSATRAPWPRPARLPTYPASPPC